jgi:hypothetical protein
MPAGIPWYEIPVGMTAAEFLAANDPDKRPKRVSVLEDSLSGSGTTMHILPPTPVFEDE